MLLKKSINETFRESRKDVLSINQHHGTNTKVIKKRSETKKQFENNDKQLNLRRNDRRLGK